MKTLVGELMGQSMFGAMGLQDATAYWERRKERRAEALHERNLARAEARAEAKQEALAPYAPVTKSEASRSYNLGRLGELGFQPDLSPGGERGTLGRRMIPVPSTPTTSMQEIEPLARGGLAMARRPYLVGERGPELMVPDQSGTIIPNHKLPELRHTALKEAMRKIPIPREEGGDRVGPAPLGRFPAEQSSEPPLIREIVEGTPQFSMTRGGMMPVSPTDVQLESRKNPNRVFTDINGRWWKNGAPYQGQSVEGGWKEFEPRHLQDVVPRQGGGRVRPEGEDPYALGSPESYGGGRRAVAPEIPEGGLSTSAGGYDPSKPSFSNPIPVMRGMRTTYAGPAGEEHRTLQQANQAFNREAGVGAYDPTGGPLLRLQQAGELERTKALAERQPPGQKALQELELQQKTADTEAGILKNWLIAAGHSAYDKDTGRLVYKAADEGVARDALAAEEIARRHPVPGEGGKVGAAHFNERQAIRSYLGTLPNLPDNFNINAYISAASQDPAVWKELVSKGRALKVTTPRTGSAMEQLGQLGKAITPKWMEPKKGINY